MNYEQVKTLSDSQFRRLCGVPRATFDRMHRVLEQREQHKRKAGRPAKLSLADQLLLTLSYWREYRTFLHVGASYGLHESNAQRTVERVEQALIRSGKFRLPKKLPRRTDDSVEWLVVAVDATETPIERPKKNSAATTVARKSATRSKRN